MFSHWILAMVLAAPLAVGSSVPPLEWEDIDGNKGSNAELAGWIVVYSFADRESSDPLMEWQDKANLEIRKRHPDLKIAHVSFADTTMVPGIFRGVAEPVMRAINHRAMKRMKEGYKDAGVKLDMATSRFSLIPDWKGKYLKAFGLKNAEKYHSFIAVDGKVAAHWDADAPEIGKKFAAWFDAYASAATDPAQ